MAQVKGHYRTIKGKRVFVEQHERADTAATSSALGNPKPLDESALGDCDDLDSRLEAEPYSPPTLRSQKKWFVRDTHHGDEFEGGSTALEAIAGSWGSFTAADIREGATNLDWNYCCDHRVDSVEIFDGGDHATVELTALGNSDSDCGRNDCGHNGRTGITVEAYPAESEEG